MATQLYDQNRPQSRAHPLVKLTDGFKETERLQFYSRERCPYLIGKADR